ncbi:MAG: aspartate 1-decarboxylase [Flavobacteriaceae bacterium]|nr:MAG: aspartate 1-decarboxylase [Flavobacteriaceae bacterium]
MLIEVLRSKIHRVKVTGAELDYIGSITIDQDLLEAANIIVGQRVQIVNVNNGERLETYTIPGKRGSGDITLNGPAARRVQKGDIIIIIAYGLIEVDKAQDHNPTVIFPDENNQLIN